MHNLRRRKLTPACQLIKYHSYNTKRILEPVPSSGLPPLPAIVSFAPPPLEATVVCAPPPPLPLSPLLLSSSARTSSVSIRQANSVIIRAFIVVYNHTPPLSLTHGHPPHRKCLWIWICPLIGKLPTGSITPMRRRQCSDFRRDLNVATVVLITVSSCRLFHAGIVFTKNEFLNTGQL